MIKNKKATFEFEKIAEYTAGIKLLGTEVKSLRKGNANLKGSFCYFKNGELFTNFHISEYVNASFKTHEPVREKKLLLKKRELKKLVKQVDQKGLTIVPFVLYFNENGLAKLDIWLAKGKKDFEKRNKILKKDIEKRVKSLTSFHI